MKFVIIKFRNQVHTYNIQRNYLCMTLSISNAYLTKQNQLRRSFNTPILPNKNRNHFVTNNDKPSWHFPLKYFIPFNNTLNVFELLCSYIYIIYSSLLHDSSLYMYICSMLNVGSWICRDLQQYTNGTDSHCTLHDTNTATTIPHSHSLCVYMYEFYPILIFQKKNKNVTL